MLRVRALTLALVLLAAEAGAWGPASHVYVVDRLMGTGLLDALFGSMMPDMYALGSTAPIQNNTQWLTHHEFDRLSPSSFALGFATHNGIWGADYYAHCYYDPSAPDTYLTERMKLMCLEFGFSMQDAELVIEGVVDYLVRQDRGPELGGLIQLSAQAFGAEDEQQLVDAFALPLTQRVSGLSIEDAEAELRSMARNWRMLLAAYGGTFFGGDLAICRATLVTGLATALDVDEQTAEAYVARAEELCWDYFVELDRIAALLPAQLEALSPSYKLPLGPGCVLGEALLLCGWLVLRTRRRATGP